MEKLKIPDQTGQLSGNEALENESSCLSRPTATVSACECCLRGAIEGLHGTGATVAQVVEQVSPGLKDWQFDTCSLQPAVVVSMGKTL